MRSFLFFFGVCVTFFSFVHAQIQYPLIIDFQFVYVKRAPNIHNKSALCQLSTTDSLEGIDTTGLLTSAQCPNNTFNGIDILREQQFAPAGRLTVSYLIDKKQTWEGRYLGPLHWEGSSSASCPGSLEFPFSGINNTVDYQNANAIKGSCDTRLWSAEVNYWYHVTPQRVDYFSISWLFGMRYFNLDEFFNLKSETNSGSSHYKIHANNKIFGPQLGGDIEGNLGCNFTWGIIGKLGPLINFAQNNTLLKDINNTLVVKRYNPSDFNLTFLGEIAPFILFNLSKSVLFKISYELTYLSNVALALNQITFREDDASDVMDHVNIRGAFMYYGLYVGLGFEF